MNLKEGALLHNGTYRIERVLGQGGFGITYLAVHVRLNKKVAIKEFFPKAFCDREADTSHVRTASKANSVTVEKLRKKFIKEAEHIAAMDSPYIVKITDVFEENHTAYYIMDYIDGRSLSEIVEKDGPLSESRAVEYITKIGEALTYIHSKRMNHLDVKPANIMVRAKDDTPILIDFGLSKQYDSEGNQTSTTPVGISHGYAPIEQYREGGVKEFSPQTDLYSLAATLYYIVSGTVPPQASILIEDELTFPASFPKNLEASIRKAMSSSRKMRQDNIQSFIFELIKLPKENLKTTHNEDTVLDHKIHNTPLPPYKTAGKNTTEGKRPNNKRKSSSSKSMLFVISSIVIIGVIVGVLFIKFNDNASVNENDNISEIPLNENQDEVSYSNDNAEEEPGSYTASFFSNPKNRSSEPSLNSYIETSSGLKYVILKKGEGRQPSSDDVITVNYEGSLSDGTVFDSSYERGEPAVFPLNAVISGWSEGVQLMHEGGKAVFYIPSDLAYGQQGVSGIIPPNSPLIFEVELIKIN